MYRIDPDKLAVARGRLIAAVGRDVTWREFAEMANVSVGTISGILNGRTHGSSKTVESIVVMLRQYGVPVLADDLLSIEEVETAV